MLFTCFITFHTLYIHCETIVGHNNSQSSIALVPKNVVVGTLYFKAKGKWNFHLWYKFSTTLQEFESLSSYASVTTMG